MIDNSVNKFVGDVDETKDGVVDYFCFFHNTCDIYGGKGNDYLHVKKAISPRGGVFPRDYFLTGRPDCFIASGN
jgi:hypothetical protein